MQNNIAAEIQLDRRELAAWERSHASQVAALTRLRDAAVDLQQTHVLTDPAGRALALATTDGTIHMLTPPVLPADSDEHDADRPDPGFHANRTQTFYVTEDLRVYRLRSPGQPVTLQRIPALPEDCEAVDADDCDHDLCLLAETADGLTDAEPLDKECVDDDATPSRPFGDVRTAYVRVDEVHYQIKIGISHTVAIAQASPGKQFQPLGTGRWDGSRVRGFESLPTAARLAIEAAIRTAVAG